MKHLTRRLYSLHQHIQEVGQPLEEFDVTPAALDEFHKSIAAFESMKSAPRLAIAARKGHNQTIPQYMSSMRTAFAILDKLVKNMEKTDPVFVRDYYNARHVIDHGGRGAGAGSETPPAKTDI